MTIRASKDSTKEERIRAALERHGDWPDRRIALTLSQYHISIKEIRAVRGGKNLDEIELEKPGTGIVSLSKVLEKYDTRASILKELEKLPRGRLMAESELCNRTARDRGRFRRCIEDNADEFRGLRLKLRLEESGDGRWYWGHPEDIAEAQRMRDL